MQNEGGMESRRGFDPVLAPTQFPNSYDQYDGLRVNRNRPVEQQRLDLAAGGMSTALRKAGSEAVMHCWKPDWSQRSHAKVR
jgi:hypothetical protein